MARTKQWLITVSHDRSIEEVSARLSAEGFAIKDVLEEIGCITGSADDATADRVKKIKGVLDVAPDMQVDLGPPDNVETW